MAYIWVMAAMSNYMKQDMSLNFISYIKIIYQEIIVCAFPSKMFKAQVSVLRWDFIRTAQMLPVRFPFVSACISGSNVCDVTSRGSCVGLCGPAPSPSPPLLRQSRAPYSACDAHSNKGRFQRVCIASPNYSDHCWQNVFASLYFF